MLSPGRNNTHNLLLIVLIGALNTITPFSIDMYLPAFPGIAKEMGTDIGQVALSVSTYFLGFALGQILYGPLLDRYGRKRPLYIGLLFYIIATIGCALATNINMLLVLRFFQALTGGVASVAAMAMVLDFFPPQKSARIISSLILILGVSPLLAPTVGGLILGAVGWRFIFVALASIVTLLLLLSFLFLPEGHQPDKSVSLLPKDIITGFAEILKQPRFYVYVLSGTFSFSGLFVYVAGSPAVFMDEFHVSPKMYSAIFAGLSIGFIGSSQFNHILGDKFQNHLIFKTVLSVQVVTSILFLLAIHLGFGTLPVVLIFLFVLLSCSGLTFPNAAAVALTPFTKNAGAASALSGFIQIGIGGLISSGVGALPFTGSYTVAIIMAVSSAIAYAILLLGKNAHLQFTDADSKQNRPLHTGF